MSAPSGLATVRDAKVEGSDGGARATCIGTGTATCIGTGTASASVMRLRLITSISSAAHVARPSCRPDAQRTAHSGTVAILPGARIIYPGCLALPLSRWRVSVTISATGSSRRAASHPRRWCSTRWLDVRERFSRCEASGSEVGCWSAEVRRSLRVERGHRPPRASTAAPPPHLPSAPMILRTSEPQK
jgi:hypothetical protein